MPAATSIELFDQWPEAETAIVSAGLEAHNLASAPMVEVRPLSAFLRAGDGIVIGGALGRTWERHAELQQLWVDPAHRGRGYARQLLQAFEASARDRGCQWFYLESFSFQAPAFYARMGYRDVFIRRGFPHGIVKHLMMSGPDLPTEGAASG